MGIRCILDSISDKLDAAPRLRESNFVFLACREEGNGLYRETNSTTSVRRDEEKRQWGNIRRLAEIRASHEDGKCQWNERNGDSTLELNIVRTNCL